MPGQVVGLNEGQPKQMLDCAQGRMVLRKNFALYRVHPAGRLFARRGGGSSQNHRVVFVI